MFYNKCGDEYLLSTEDITSFTSFRGDITNCELRYGPSLHCTKAKLLIECFTRLKIVQQQNLS